MICSACVHYHVHQDYNILQFSAGLRLMVNSVYPCLPWIFETYEIQISVLPFSESQGLVLTGSILRFAPNRDCCYGVELTSIPGYLTISFNLNFNSCRLTWFRGSFWWAYFFGNRKPRMNRAQPRNAEFKTSLRIHRKSGWVPNCVNI